MQLWKKISSNEYAAQVGGMIKLNTMRMQDVGKYPEPTGKVFLRSFVFHLSPVLIPVAESVQQWILWRGWRRSLQERRIYLFSSHFEGFEERTSSQEKHLGSSLRWTRLELLKLNTKLFTCKFVVCSLSCSLPLRTSFKLSSNQIHFWSQWIRQLRVLLDNFLFWLPKDDKWFCWTIEIHFPQQNKRTKDLKHFRLLVFFFGISSSSLLFLVYEIHLVDRSSCWSCSSFFHLCDQKGFVRSFRSQKRSSRVYYELIPDASNKTFVITGGNSGIGFETAKALAKRNATVILGKKQFGG